MELGKIQQGLEEFPFSFSPDLSKALQDYLRLLERWNKTYNLTGIRDTERMVTHHLLDSLSIVPFIEGTHIADVGSGAGLPGIPLALHFPDKQFTLIDSNGKKTRFLTQAKIALGLNNVTVVQERMELVSEKFDQVICRALAPLVELAKSCAHLMAANGTLLAMKSADHEALSEATPLEVKCRTQLRVPMVKEDRVVITLARKASSKTISKSL
jgi:16S rRNA (guanine527-N7)-methyltransferase